jgi:hypothetical protein
MLIKDFTVQFAKEHYVTFRVKESSALVNHAEEWAMLFNQGKELELIVKPVTKKRSLSQNSYAWTLISQIADVLRACKQDIYIQMLSTYGQREPVTFAVIDKAFDTLQKSTDGYAIKIGERVHQDKIYFDVAILRGSSTYDSREMSILIEGIMSECKDLHIATKSMEEVRLMSLI